MILLEKSMIEGETLLRGHDFARANAVFAALNADIDAFAKNMKAKGEARQGYDKILLRIKDLEIARELAPGTLDTAFEAAGAGRQLLNEGNFSGAMREFERGYAALRKAEAALAEHVRASLVRGQKALAQGLKSEASEAFKAALEKAPGNEVALLGLKRAENIDRVHALLLHGAKLEQEKQFALAAEAFGKAFALDGQSAEAQQGQARAARLEKEARFASAKSAADQAVQRREWDVAIREFQNALKVYPQKTEVQNALKAAREQAHKESVQKMMAKGYVHEDRREWKEAREAFNAALELEPGMAEAKEAYTRAGTVIRALLQYERLIETTEQLVNRAEFQAALKRFNEALANKPSYLEPSERVLQLRKLLQEQSKPVEVAFKSDGNLGCPSPTSKHPFKPRASRSRVIPAITKSSVAARATVTPV
jgi:tetratricopeptide (TPR) repeat protein